MKAPYPVDRQRIDLLHQTFAFISEVKYDDITFIDSISILVDYFIEMEQCKKSGRGRKFDFAITKDVLIKWNEIDSSDIFDMFIWVIETEE